ncbi:MAG: addiction module protein [Deltaproteobacteria bacterium]|nr:addiction module protein [Deltaproteobacteria bacterium]
MLDTAAIKQLSRKEKLWIMEAIWKDLSMEDELIESPAWHKKALSETENRLRAGQEQLLDWKDAKEELRKRFE